VARFIKDALEEQPLTIYGDGLQTRDLIHVADLCAAILATLNAPAAVGQTIQIATGVETRILDLAYMMRETMGRPRIPVRFLPPRPGEIRRKLCQYRSAQQILNWSPTIPVSSGVLQTCQWFLEQRVGVGK